MRCLSGSLQKYIYYNNLKKMHKKLDQFLDYMADSGYTDNEEISQDILQKYKLLENDCKMYIHDISKLFRIKVDIREKRI